MLKKAKLYKRAMDLILASLFVLVFSPVYIITMLIIFLQDRGSPFYSQERVGLNNTHFMFYKFRSMVINADEILFNDPKLYKQARSGEHKIKDDPRITKFGKFIRKYSIYEFPQMFNVLKGDMSFVGPRALRPDEYKMYASKSKNNARNLRHLTSVKPGITGHWQVNGRSNVDFDNRIKMDCYYADHTSLLFDIKIIIKTPIAVIKGDGAY